MKKVKKKILYTLKQTIYIHVKSSQTMEKKTSNIQIIYNIMSFSGVAGIWPTDVL